MSEIEQEVKNRNIRLTPIRRYHHIEPTNGKSRIIGIESVKQQILDYVAALALESFLDARIGYYQVASVRGKGQLFAARSVKRWVRDSTYWVHIDVRKCYPSIKHDVVMGILSKHIKSDDVLYLCRTLLSTYGGGLEIGSFFSLRMAQLVLSYGYHHVESLHKERRGSKIALVDHQLWYMDDAIIMSDSKRDLRMAVRSLSRYMRNHLGLSIKPWKLCMVGDMEPVDIAGFVIRRSRTTIRSSIFIRARRSFRKYERNPNLAMARRVCSYWGWISNSDSLLFIERNNALNIKNDARNTVSENARKRVMNEQNTISNAT
ncbi:MAG: reverse transcriptase domain-containing protein [Gordonibacter sp.]|uniref:reverse transcriptase domain-containing protein n=1 Tax=Gordonibacter sp. TaxID=1968902 RepID=UPI002FC87F99